MSTRSLFRMSGIVLLIGSLVYIVGTVLGFILGSGGTDGPPHPAVALTFAIGVILLILGSTGFYARQAHKAGLLGLIGWPIFIASGMLSMSGGLGAALFVPLIPASVLASPEPPMTLFLYFLISTSLTVIGGILLGIATARAGVFPALVGWLLVASSVLAGVGFPLTGLMSNLVVTASDLLLMAAFVWSGYVLMGTAETSMQTSSSEATLPASS